jgi:hypothetical protein
VIQDPRYRLILRSIFTAVMQSGLSTSDLRLLAQELRRGRLPDELAYMLDSVNQHFQDSPNLRNLSDQLKTVERLMKEKKVSKLALLNILRSIDTNIIPKPGVTTRSILRGFFTSATSQEIAKLIDVLNATGDADPYLKGISETRR